MSVRAVVLEQYGGPEVLIVREIPDPSPGPGEVRLQVAATALNRADVYQRQGRYPPPDPRPAHEIPGLEVAGTVAELGEGVTGVDLGQRVCGLLPGGGYAEQVVIPSAMLLAIPDAISLVEAAAIPEVFLTAYDALIAKGRVSPGEVVLIHAGGSGVGTAAVQLARVLGAKTVLVTTRTAWKADRCVELGANAGIVPNGGFAERVLEASDGHGADVILDFMGASYMEQNLRAVALEGRIVLIATLGGSKAELSVARLMRQRISLIGTTLRSRTVEQKIALTRAFAPMMQRFARGELRPVIDRTFALRDVAEAHRHLESNTTFGKVVLTLD